MSRDPGLLDEVNRTDESHWLHLARHTPIALLADLDGTLIPFADRPQEARVPGEVAALLQDLASGPGCQVAIVSGRKRDSLEGFFPTSPSVWLIAEHGGWRRDAGAWTRSLPVEDGDLKSLAIDLESIAGRVAGAAVLRLFQIGLQVAAPADIRDLTAIARRRDHRTGGRARAAAVELARYIYDQKGRI